LVWGLVFGLGVGGSFEGSFGGSFRVFRGLSKIHKTVASNENMKIKMTSSPRIEHILVV
jgi:hypothetical protein